MRAPDFDELIGADVTDEERERLRVAHDALLLAGPPAELPPRLAEPPAKTWESEVAVLPRGIPRRRLAASLVLAAALAAAAFGGGYLVGDSGGGGEAVEPAVAEGPVAELRGVGDRDAVVIVRFGKPDSRGNTPMLVTAERLDPLSNGDYYILDMTEDGERKATCGTFNVAGKNKRTTLRFTVAYDVDEYDGLAVVVYRAKGHTERVLLTGKLTRA